MVSSSDEEEEGAAAVPKDINSMKLELEKLKNLTTRKEEALKHAKQMLGMISNDLKCFLITIILNMVIVFIAQILQCVPGKSGLTQKYAFIK